MDQPVRVIYILGWGRSGSTILDNLLGSIEGFFSVGELTYLWSRGVIGGRSCGCGLPIGECPIWKAVLSSMFENENAAMASARDAVRWQRKATRVRDTLRLLRTTADESPKDPALGSLISLTNRLYKSIAATTGARVIIDSSKRPSDAALLRLLPGIEPSFLHLVRDPRAVAYSWQRRKLQLDKSARPEMVRHGVVNSTLSWTGWNIAAESLRRKVPSDKWRLLRYEDFVTDPVESIWSVVSLAGENPKWIPVERPRTALLGSNHTASGNPSRFKTGRIELREDDEWIHRQGRLDRVISTTLAIPLLGRYGYPLNPSHSRVFTDAASHD